MGWIALLLTTAVDQVRRFASRSPWHVLHSWVETEFYLSYGLEGEVLSRLQHWRCRTCGATRVTRVRRGSSRDRWRFAGPTEEAARRPPPETAKHQAP
jgi:hypothetical protein